MIAFSPNSTIGKLLLLRSFAIVAQLAAVMISYFWLDAMIMILPALFVIAMSSFFQLASVYAYRNHTEANPPGMLMQLAADVLFLTLLLAFTGGATNAFVSLLLLPIVISAITLNLRAAVLIGVAAVLSYTWLLWKMPSQTHQHHNMTTHFQAMWLNFVFSAVVIVWVVSSLADKIRSNERRMAALREQQIYQEQLVALGASAAQVAHQLASPLANLQLLHEELVDEYPSDCAISDMRLPLSQCKALLEEFRKQSQFMQSAEKHDQIDVSQLISQLKELLLLEYPLMTIELSNTCHDVTVVADPMLVRALQNIVNNAARASIGNGHQHVFFNSYLSGDDWVFEVKDYGKGFDERLLESLGTKPIQSESGFGVGLFLSQSTLKRLGGAFTAENNTDGATVKVRVPRGQQ